MNRQIIIALLLISCFKTTSAQDAAKTYNTLKQQLKSRLTFLNNYRYLENQDLDVEKYASKTSEMLSQFLSIKRIESSTLKRFKNLQLSAKSNDSLQVHIYDFGYHCGGSRGWITHPIIQWQDQSGKLHTYDFSKKINCEFHEIHKLKSSSGNYYLLIGNEIGNSSNIQNIAYVITIDRIKVSADHKAYVNRPYINLCNTEISFNPQSQILKFVNEYESDDFLLHIQSIPPTNDTTATKKLLKMFSRQYNEPICLKFNNGKFTRLTKCR
jgi:hypothetical protein